ncbi:MAG: 23S rRNA (uracil(1939)-C(5))-methyltransferase RlmD [Vicinamibacterales bacterium]
MPRRSLQLPATDTPQRGRRARSGTEPRVDRCRHLDSCGGCGWQQLSYAEQCRRKRLTVQQLLKERLGDAAPVVGPPLTPVTVDAGTSGPWGFRQKVHFVCAPERAGGIALGHFAAGGQRVMAVSECPVHDPRGQALAGHVRDICVRAGLTAAQPDGRGGLLRHIVIRTSRTTGESLVTLVVTNARDPRLVRVAERIAAAPLVVAGVHVSELRGPSSWLLGPRTRRLTGRDFVQETIAETTFLIGPTTFFQTNIAAAECLVRVVMEAIPVEATDVADLYAGVGLFSLPLARRGHRVLAIEEHRGAVSAGERAARLNRLDDSRCRFVCARVERGFASIPRRVRAVVLDPPRAGCTPSVTKQLYHELAPELIVYVSCDPATLARDLAALLAGSRRARRPYRLQLVQPVDMFPHTPHIETVAVLVAEAPGA